MPTSTPSVITTTAASAKQGLKAVKKQLHDGEKAMAEGVSKAVHKVKHQTSDLTKKAAEGTQKAFSQLNETAKATGKVITAPLESLGSKLKTSTSSTTTKSRAASIRESSVRQSTTNGGGAPLLPAVGPDESLQKMDVILRKRIHGLTVEQFYESIWKEQNKDKAFYKSWLEASGKDSVEVQDWQVAEGGVSSDSPFAFRGGSWEDDETIYGAKRLVSFQFTRTTHLYTGPPLAKVKQTHFCKLSKNENERCIVHIQVEMEGIPFCNCFNVQIRWVITRLGEADSSQDLDIQIGLYVNFVEPTIMAGKIRSGTTEETTKSQQSLLQAVLKECSEHAGAGVVVVTETDDEVADIMSSVETTDNACFVLSKLFADLFQKHKSRKNDMVTKKASTIQHHMELLLEKWSKVEIESVDPNIEAQIESELTDIQAALATIDMILFKSQGV